MLHRFAQAALAALILCTPGTAEEFATPEGTETFQQTPSTGLWRGRERLGQGRVLSNDLIGDGKDRWRTGSLSSSRVWGYRWDGIAPSRAGDLLELRIQGQIIAPARLRNPDPDDRPYAGSLAAGLHTHFTARDVELSMGADLVVIGPRTGLDHLQDELHQLVNITSPSDGVLAAQIGNKIRPTAVVEAGRRFAIGTNAELRPFAEARAGDETLVRVGADLELGLGSSGGLKVRDTVSGQRYGVIRGDGTGLSLVLGADVAHVFDSVYLPSDRGIDLVDQRERVRLGLRWKGQAADIFYGATWLGKEFEAQAESQVIGTIRVDFRF